MKERVYKIGCTIVEKCNLSREKYETELHPEYLDNVDEETAAIFATNALYDAIAQIVTSAGYACINQNPCLYFKVSDYFKALEMAEKLNLQLSELYQQIDPGHEFPGVWDAQFIPEIGGRPSEGQKYTGKVFLNY